MALFHPPSVQSPKAYDLANLQPQQLGARLFPANASETGGNTPADFRWQNLPLYDVRRQGCVLDGVTNDYANFNKAVAVASALGLSIVIDGPLVLGTNITIPANVQVWFIGTGLLRPSAGITVTINGPVCASNQKIFDLAAAGSSIAGSLGNVDWNICWWGCVGDGDYAAVIAGTDNSPALQKVADAAHFYLTLGITVTSTTTRSVKVKAPAGVYRCNSRTNWQNGVVFQGAGYYATVFFAPNAFADALGLFNWSGADTTPSMMCDCAVIAQTNGAGLNGNGIVSTKNGMLFERIWIAAFSQGVGLTLNNTDNYAHGCIFELNNYGFEIKQLNCTVSHGTTYQNNVAGCIIDNATVARGGSVVDTGRVHINNMRFIEDHQQGVVVSSGNRVTLNACSFFDSSTGALRFTDAAVRLDVADDIVLNACVMQIHTQSVGTNSGVSVTGASTNIRITGSVASGFRDGINVGANGATVRLTVTGCDCSGNARYGIIVFTGNEVLVSGNTCDSNGTTGIKADNSLSAGKWGIVGNRCQANATFDFDLNCGATMFINLVGNTKTVAINKTGTVANINDVGSL